MRQVHFVLWCSGTAVDFKIKRAPACRVACVTEEGNYSDRAIRSSFTKVAQWAASKGLGTGNWLFIEQEEKGNRIRWKACIEILGDAAAEGVFEIKTLKATDVISVMFDPDEVSSRVVYHAINDWARWRKKDGTIARTGRFREIYPGDPWKDASAWKDIDVQLTIARRGKKGD